MPTPFQTPGVPVSPAPPALPAAQAGAQGASLEALQAQAINLNAQLAGLRAERDVLRSVINSNRTAPEFRASQAGRYADLNQQMARVDGQLDQVRAQIADLQGVPVDRVGQAGQVITIERPARRGPDPDMVVGLTFTLAMCFVIPLSIAWARRIWRSKAPPAPARSEEVLLRLDRLDQAVDAVAIEIERVAEGQRFVTKVMAERAHMAPSAAQPASVAGAERDGARSDALDARPVLELGAGPVEPVRAPLKETVDARR